MIKAVNLTKKFGNFTALSAINCTIPEGCIYGLVGSNGAGKSTFIRLLAGIYRPDSGTATIDDKLIYENPEVKKRIAYVSDELYFLPQASMNRMAKLYSRTFENFNFERFHYLTNALKLNPNVNVNSFSKGMKRQAATILALSTMPDYILFDETFDGLDPVMRNTVKNIIYSDVCERKSTAVISSHSLRELEDTCDQLALLHKGGIIFESDIENLKTSLFKVQIAFNEDYEKDKFKGIEIINFQKKGSVANLIIRGEREATVEKLKLMKPVLLDVLPLTLEEVFIYEMDALGYAFKDLMI
ncbi:ABC transporter ATP-binding protein [[Clostridium] cellulosi]